MRNGLILAMCLIIFPAAAQPRVLVVRFEQLDQTPGMVWIGRAIQQSLATDLNRSRAATAELLPETKSVGTTDTTVARQLGREQAAQYVVAGGFQSWDGGLRITGSVINVETGEVAGSLKSTGQLDGLFLMQDVLGTQLKQIINPQAAARAPVAPEMLSIPNSKPIGVATIKPLKIETPAVEPWKEEAQNRHNLLPATPWAFCGWWGGWRCGWFGFHGAVGRPVNGIGW